MLCNILFKVFRACRENQTFICDVNPDGFKEDKLRRITIFSIKIYLSIFCN